MLPDGQIISPLVHQRMARFVAFAMLVLGCSAFQARALRHPPAVVQPALRSSAPVALLPPSTDVPLGLASTAQLAGIIGGVGYGGKDSFWENAGSSASGDVATLFFLVVIFPVVVTVFFFIDRD